jgi:hypothetical protein
MDLSCIDDANLNKRYEDSFTKRGSLIIIQHSSSSLSLHSGSVGDLQNAILNDQELHKRITNDEERDSNICCCGLIKRS